MVAEKLDTGQSTTRRTCAFDYLMNALLFVDERVFVFSVLVLPAGRLSPLPLVRGVTLHPIALSSFDPITVTPCFFHWMLRKR